MYRAVALFVLRHQIDLTNPENLVVRLDEIEIELLYHKEKFAILLNGEDITQKISTLEVSSIVSEVAAIPEVRKKLVREQQKIGRQKGVVMDGRDIGTVVFPDAEVKLFVTADIDVRTERRFLELQQKGMQPTYAEVKANLLHRDYIDSSREDSPLVQAQDAIKINNSQMSRDEQLLLATGIINEVLNKKGPE